MKKILFTLAFFFCVVTSANAATFCKTLTNTTTDIKPIGPIYKSRMHASLQIFITSGVGTVGSYTIQESNMNTDTGWIDNGSAITSAGIAKETDVTAQFVRAKINALPGANTTVMVCLYADGIGE